MTRSTLVGAIAGLLLIADGVTFVSSRIGMLDIFLALFVIAAFGCLIVDRDRGARADGPRGTPRAGSSVPDSGPGSGCAGGGSAPA